MKTPRLHSGVHRNPGFILSRKTLPVRRILIASIAFLFAMLISGTIRAGQSQIIFPFPTVIPCCQSTSCTVIVQNIHPVSSLTNVNSTFEFKRNDKVVLTITVDGPPGNTLLPGAFYQTQIEVPSEILMTDGPFVVRYMFDSDFDLNPTPYAERTATVEGCGMTAQAAIDFILDYMAEHWEDFLPPDAPKDFEYVEDALMFYYPELLKAETILTDPFSRFLLEIDVFSWLFAIDWEDEARYEKPITFVALNSNTMEITIVHALWYALLFPPGATDGNVFSLDPVENADMIIRGTPPEAVDPPMPLEGMPVASMPADEVCAILVTGNDMPNASLHKSFINDVFTMERILTQHEKGPRLPESSILKLYGVSKDSLKVHLANLKDKYKKVYFFYSGHGSIDGSLCTGENLNQWISYVDLMEALYDSNADDVIILLDCCYSGLVIEAACNDPRIKSRDVQILVSSDENKTSRARIYNTDSGGAEWFGALTTETWWAIHDNEADVNNDDKVSFCEAYDKVIEKNRNNIVMEQNPQKKTELNSTFMKIATIFEEAAREVYGSDQVNRANLHISPTLIGPGVPVRSFDEKNNFTVDDPAYFGWIDHQPNNLFGKDVSYAFMNAADNEVTFVDGLFFWPVIHGIAAYSPYDPLYVISENTSISKSDMPETIDSPQEGMNDDPRTCALIVTGLDMREHVQKAITTTADIVVQDLTTEELGPGLTTGQIRLEHGISGDALLSILASMQGLYDKVYFVYIGHGGHEGQLALGASPGEWLTYETFLTALDAVGAAHNYVIAESSFSGKLQQVVRESGLFGESSLDIYSATTRNTSATVNYYLIDGEIDGVGHYGLHLMRCLGDPSAERDGVPGISLKEAADWVYVMNPADNDGNTIYQGETSQVPKYSIRRQIGLPRDLEERIIVTDCDISVNNRRRSALAVDATVELVLDLDEKTSADPNVFAISPVRTWIVSGDLTTAPGFAVDLEFYFTEGIDVLSNTEGLMGLVSRSDATQEWMAYYPSQYFEEEGRIVAQNVTDARQWAIARVAEAVHVMDLSQDITDLMLYPNPASIEQGVTLMLSALRELPLTLSISDLNGTISGWQYSAITHAGKQNIHVPVADLVPGIYVLLVTTDSGTAGIPFVVR